MRTIPILLACLLIPLPALADHEGKPHEACHGRENTCTEVPAGTMECMPESGVAAQLSAVVGSADNGVFELKATGTNLPGSDTGCLFEIRVRTDDIRFNEGYTVGLLGPYGDAGDAGWSPCYANPGETCEAKASFWWWRAQHGVTFDVPFDLVVNGQVVASGSCHYYDPPLFEELVGGQMVLP